MLRAQERAAICGSRMRATSLLRETVPALLECFGYQFTKLNPVSELLGPILPRATYSPWHVDVKLQTVIRKNKGYMLINDYRCYAPGCW